MVRGSLILAVLAVAVGAPSGWAAKPKLYRVSLRGDVHKEASLVTAGDPPPLGCTGDSTITHRFAASVSISPRVGRVAIASYGRLVFRALLTSPTATSTTQSVGSWAPDPYLPPDDPSVCNFKPQTKEWPCRFAPEAVGPSGAEVALYPKNGTYELYYNRAAGLLSCTDEEIDSSLLNPTRTTLRVGAVKRLARARSTSGSGVAVTPGDSGNETLHYALRVERVR
jgi:hypothetical protein